MITFQTLKELFHYSIKHPPNYFVETYKHKLSLLANADEALSSWLKYFSLH